MLVGIRLLIASSITIICYIIDDFNLLITRLGTKRMQLYVCLVSNLIRYFPGNKKIIFIWIKQLIFDDVYKIFMTFFLFHCLLHFYKLEKPIENQPKNPLRLNNKNLELFHSGNRSRPHAIRYNLSHSGQMCGQLRDRFPQPLQSWHLNFRLINRY